MPKSAKRLLLRGSLIAFKRKCGKANCHCKNGTLHESFALSYRVQGKTKILTLRSEDLATVREAIGRYNRALKALELRAQLGITELTRQIWRERGYDGSKRARRP
jgi:hypothetical protein